MEHSYVTAMRALGASPARVTLGHILPNVASVALVQFTITLPLTILLETALSFLGLGVQSPLTSLAQIMSEGRDKLLTAWWLTLFPGATDVSLKVYCQTSNIMSATFSAIIMVGALVFPEMIEGIIDASTTLRPVTPRTRACGSTTEPASAPMRQVPTGW